MMGQTAALAMTGFGAGFQSAAEKRGGKAQAELNRFNAEAAEMQADDAIVRGKEAEARHRQVVKQLIGAQRAAFGASGVDVNQGNALDVQADTASMGELDALTIQLNAAREAWGYRNQAIDYRARGELAEMEGQTKAIGTLLSAGGSVLYKKFGFGATTRNPTTKR